MQELLAFEYAKISVDKKANFEKFEINAACVSSLTIGKIF